MRAWGCPFQLRHWVLLLTSLVLIACAGVLGIEDRKLDTADNYPPAGYDGCRPGGRCDGCLAVHLVKCEARSVCADSAGLDECVSCVCRECVEPLSECQNDPRCVAVWQCLRQTRCDLSEGADGNCVEACGGVVAANGGVNGAPFRAATAIRACAVTESCLSCLPPQAAPPPETCRPQNGCMECADCFQQCLCSGDSFSACRELCGEESPPETCSGADGCAGCSNCFDVCTCQGGQFAACADSCTTTNPTCTAATGCLDCDGCVSHCVCSGGTPAACETTCQTPVSSDKCSEDSSDSGSANCGGCSSCLASCTCSGTALEECMATCNLHGCCGTDTCDRFTACTCGSSGDACAATVYGSCDVIASGCNYCPCNGCAGKYALCYETAGCLVTFDCMRSTQCQGSGCVDRCGEVDSQGGDRLAAFAAAEALWACHQGTDCSCTEGNPAVIQCSPTTQCSGHFGANASIGACCSSMGTDPVGTGGGGFGGGPASGESACGLYLDSYYYPFGPGCVVKGQLNPPRETGLEVCPYRLAPGPVYNGAKLKGCCRSDGLCGYFDDITGLGCLDTYIFDGVSSTQYCF